MKLTRYVLAIDIDLLQKTFLMIKLLKLVEYYFVIVQFVMEKHSMIVSDNNTAAESLDDFFNSFGEKRPNASETMEKNVLRNPGTALEIGANVSTAFASRSPEAALSSLP